MNWRDYWNGDSPVYVSERHKLLHARTVASDEAELIAELARAMGLAGKPVVLDHGCGEQLALDRVRKETSRLYLIDGAETVRTRLAARVGGAPDVVVLSPEEIETIADGSLDVIVAHSLVQYLPPEELRTLMAVWHRKLKPQGALVLGDVIPHSAGAATDAVALLAFAARSGFVMAALAGLARTALSDYRKLRAELGLTRYDEGDVLALLTAAGFDASRRRPNLGHNQARMTLIGRKSFDPIKAPSRVD